MDKNFSSITGLGLQPLRRTTITEQVYEQILELILTGKINPGQHLVEQSLADHLQVSKISIREAVRALSKEGLVEIIPNRGAYVVNLSFNDVIEVYQVRAVIEGMAVELAVENLDESSIQELQKMIHKMEDAEEADDHLIGSALDTQFHRYIMNLSKHKLAIQVWEQMSSRILMVVYNVSNFYPNYKLIAERHQNLLNIMKSGEKKSASEFLHVHIMEGAARLLEAMGQKTT